MDSECDCFGNVNSHLINYSLRLFPCAQVRTALHMDCPFTPQQSYDTDTNLLALRCPSPMTQDYQTSVWPQPQAQHPLSLYPDQAAILSFHNISSVPLLPWHVSQLGFMCPALSTPASLSDTHEDRDIILVTMTCKKNAYRN